MDKLNQTLEKIVSENLYRIIISKPFHKGDLTKIVIRPVMIRKQLKFQETQYVGTKVIHTNFDRREIAEKIQECLMKEFGQLEAECADRRVMILTSKKGSITIKEKKLQQEAKKNQQVMDHNRTKNYILKDGEPADFLVALGVQMPDGRVAKAKYHKFKQINRYLEFVEDILPVLEGEETIRIIDFGCGKSYLTFALYYYLKMKQNKNVDIIGLDLKKDVIADCNQLRDKLHYDGLKFLQGDIKDYENDARVDMVVSLHACDTATDYAIAKAVGWDAKVILAVPCCQHEVNRQIKCEELVNITKYGILKERMAAIITDAYRANCMEKAGYDTQILEFIDLEHTPKNLLIRGVKRKMSIRSQKEVEEIQNALPQMEGFLNIHPTLGKLLKQGKVSEKK